MIRIKSVEKLNIKNNIPEEPMSPISNKNESEDSLLEYDSKTTPYNNKFIID